MRWSLRLQLLSALIFAATMGMLPAPAAAKGCLKGAIVGGAAGHYAGHHGILGAAAGCLIGRHEARKREQNQTVGRGGEKGSQ